jgi:hypothetical protein
VFGDNFGEMSRNQALNPSVNRVAAIQATFERSHS